MKQIKFILLAIITPVILTAQVGEKIDILHTDINLSIDQQKRSIDGYSTLTLTPTTVIDDFDLFLQGMTIDSVLLNDEKINFQRTNDSILDINLWISYQPTDTFDLSVYYHGQPDRDASGWGGFYFTNGFAFNLGVGFAADPHPFGRVWFPCKDDFTDKSTFTFDITTSANDMALCNGELTDSTSNSEGSITWHWEMNDPIASYLVSIAAAPYRPAQEMYDGVASSYPIWYGGRGQDTSDMKKSFKNLLNAIAAFEEAFGPQVFNRVGFALVPFGGGAMEHATNIAYPLNAANGGIQSETLMAHELAHHWWGDWVTCENAEEMWLNEGWASWSEFWFLEYVYGKSQYQDAVFNNRKNVIYRAHKNDDGYRAVQGIPHDYTYGTHVYDKGADVAHSLRGYMGDQAFFECIKNYLVANAWENMNSADFRDFLTNCSGQDLEPFFDGYVFNPGYPQFSVDSMKTGFAGGNHKAEVFIRQRLHHAPDYFKEVPLELTFVGKEFQRETRKVTLPGECTSLSIQLDFEPAFVIINDKEKVSTATFQELMPLDQQVSLQQTKADMKFNLVDFPEDSILLHVQHHLVTPDREGVPAGVILSDNHYWELKGLFSKEANIIGEVEYDGNPNNDSYDWDKNLISNAEDSVIILYREGAGHDWEVWPDIVRTVLGSSDKTGTITIKGMKRGEYALGIYDASRTDTVQSEIPSQCEEIILGTLHWPSELPELKIIPNPTNDSAWVEFSSDADQLTVFNLQSQIVHQSKITGNRIELLSGPWPAGSYLVVAKNGSQPVGVGKLVVE